ncbi:MAG: hypothetical protein HC853_00895 [Anaerolineae bacterium]|nr:hypothetical protein [Anaerolineae bacterium]
MWSRQARVIDEAVSESTRAKLESTFNDQNWRAAIGAVVERHQNRYRLTTAQIEALSTTMSNLVESLTHLKMPELIQQVEQQYAQAKSEKDRLESELAQDQQQSSLIEAIVKLRDEYEPAIANWDEQPPDKRRTIIQVFIDCVEVEPAKRGTNITINWRDGSNDTLFVRRPCKGVTWLPNETERLIKIINEGATQVEVAATFPERTWKAIGHKIKQLTSTTFTVGRKGIHEEERYADYLNRVHTPKPVSSERSS